MFGFSNGDLVFCEHLADFAEWVIKITGYDGMFGTYDYACRLHSDVGPVGAVVALSGCPRIRVDINCIIRTGLKTRFAPDAYVRIELHDTVFPLVHRCNWTNTRTGWVFAMIATCDLEVARHIGISTRFNTLNPRPIHPKRDLILAFTSRRARMAANAPIVPNEKSVIHAS